MPEYNSLKYGISEGIGTLTLDRPPANVIDIAMLREMEIALAEAAKDSSLKVLVVKAEGKLFSAGVDVADHTPERVDEMIPLFDQVSLALAEFPTPTLAVVHGHALGGGCELVIVADLAIMAAEARIGQPEIQLASIPPIASLRLPGMIGPRWAAQLLFTGEQIQAAQAMEIGLVNKVVPRADLEQAVAEQLSKLKRLSAAALRYAKRGFLMGIQGWDSQLEAFEHMYLQELMALEDAEEGMRAFIEKRKPEWKDR